jgi:DNA polymerase V
MTFLYSQSELTFHALPASPAVLKLPKFLMRVECGGSTTGFASPADDYIETHLDLNQFHDIRRHACFLVEAVGDSMIDAGITEHDLLIVDTSLDYRENDIVICSVNGTYKAKIIRRMKGRLFLVSKNPAFAPIEIQEQDDFQVFGVVKGLSRNFRRS